MLPRFLPKTSLRPLASLCAAVGILLTTPDAMRAATAPDERIYPPRVYLTQPSLNKSGVCFAIKGEDNFLRIFVPAIDASKHEIPAGGLVCKVLLPENATLLPEPDLPLTITKTTVDGRPMQEVSFKLPEKDVLRISQSASARASKKLPRIELILWYRVDDLPVGEGGPIRLSLEMDGKTCFTDEAKLQVFDALKEITPIDPNIFRMYLHYGPQYRAGKWDELAAALRRYGINCVQVIDYQLEMMQAMRERGFSVITHRLGNYLNAYHPGTVVSDTLEQGMEWFEKADGGVTKASLAYADVATWDFEPSPRSIVTDEKTLGLFREFAKIPGEEKLDEGVIKAKYMKKWIAFRQKQFAGILRNWADWVRSLKSDTKTLVSEGTVSVFDPSGQIDYRNWSDAVTYIDPMSFCGPVAVRGMRQWKSVTPGGVFVGCMNVAQSARSSVTYPANTIMLTIASAALMGNSGAGIYPGQTMDGENFVTFNRVMGFLGENQEIIWKGEVQPKEVALSLLPKQDETITLATGDTLRNVYPNWENDSVAQTYKSKSGDAYLAGIVNWNVNEPCYAKIQIKGLSGKWMLVDDEARHVYTHGGKSELGTEVLAEGALVSIAPSDYRGFRVARVDASAANGYKPVALEEMTKEYSRYSDSSKTANDEGKQEGSIRFDYDDIDGDKMVEYVVTTPSQKVWINQSGCVVRWEAGKASREGLFGRDQLWIPVSERGNAFPDGAMQLVSRQSTEQGAEIVLSRNIALTSLGSMLELQMTKKLTISDKKSEIAVEATIQNSSLSTQVTSLDVGYRVHNQSRYDGEVTVWANDGASLAKLDSERRFIVPGEGLDPKIAEHLHATYTRLPERKLAAFGEYRPKDQSLLAFVPERAGDLLQMLRWLSEDHRLGTVEWMYRPVKLGNGESWKAAYRINLKGDAASLSPAAVDGLLPSNAR